MVNKVDIDTIKSIDKNFKPNTRPFVAKIMRACGCTWEEIGEYLGTSRQNAKQMVDEKWKNK